MSSWSWVLSCGASIFVQCHSHGSPAFTFMGFLCGFDAHASWEASAGWHEQGQNNMTEAGLDVAWQGSAGAGWNVSPESIEDIAGYNVSQESTQLAVGWNVSQGGAQGWERWQGGSLPGSGTWSWESTSSRLWDFMLYQTLRFLMACGGFILLLWLCGSWNFVCAVCLSFYGYALVLWLDFPRDTTERILMTGAAFVKCFWHWWCYTSDGKICSRRLAMKEVSRQGSGLEMVSRKLKGDREVVMRAVSSNGWALLHASEELRRDREVVLEAVSHDGSVLQCVPEELRDDREVVMKALSMDSGSLFMHGGPTLQYVSEKLKGDREVVMKAVSQDGSALEFASEELRGDREVVMEAVSRDGSAFRHATQELRQDMELMEVASASAGRRPWGTPHEVPEHVVLTVMLLSGRRCNQSFSRHMPVHEVLYECGELLGMDPHYVARSGTLIQGTYVIEEDLQSLEVGKVHVLTLVLH